MPLKITKMDSYAVSKDGRVFATGIWRGIENREMKQWPNDDGYPAVRIMIEGKRRNISVHRLVAAYYLGPKPSPNHEVRHIDGDRTNNHVENLAWGTRKENADDREKHGKTSRGKAHSEKIKAGIYAGRAAALSLAKGTEVGE